MKDISARSVPAAADIVAKIKALGRKFRNDRRGMSMILTGFSLVPIAGAMALSYDTAQAYMVKSRLSSAVDAAALAGGRVYYDENRNTDIRHYFDANFPEGYMGTTLQEDKLDITTPDGANSGKLQVAATVTMPTTFVRVLGIKSMTISSSAQTTRQASLLDVVLSMDVSGSMLRYPDSETKASDIEQSRIGAARKAALILTDIIYGNPPSPNVRVGVVPWGGKVNVSDYGSKHGEDSSHTKLPDPAPGTYGTKGVNRYWSVDAGGTYNNPYKVGAYTYRYKEGSKWEPDDGLAPYDEIVDTYTKSNGSTGYIRARNMFGYAQNGDYQYLISGGKLVPRHEATFDRIYYAHNSAVPLLAPPPPGWNGCVYARYAFTGTPPDEDNSSYPGGLNNSSDKDNAADMMDGTGVDVGPDHLAWLGWMPMGEESDSTSHRCTAGKFVRSDGYCTTCPSAGIFRMQNDKTAVQTMLGKLEANDNNYTNMPQGLVWAWRVLSPGEPFIEASQISSQMSNYQRDRAIVILTDGVNTTIRGDAYDRGLSSQYQREERTKAIATNVKQNGTPNNAKDDILIYTIQFADSNSDIEALLKKVASSEDEPFYNYAPSEEKLKDIFKAVGTNLANLRISK